MVESRREAVRLRLGEGRFLDAAAMRPVLAGGPPVPEPVPAPATVAATPVPPAAGPEPPPASVRAAPAFTARPVIALVEAVPAGAEELAALLVDAFMGAGLRAGAISLDRENRLARRLAGAAAAPAWCWKQAAPELLLRQGLRVVVPGPAAEGEVSSEAVEGVLHRVQAAAEAVVVDLGCRWEPRLFRSVLLRATQIWVITRSGQWSGTEMRLGQAEYSGWTDMQRVRVVAVGGAAPPGALGAPVAAVLPDPVGEAAKSFVRGEVGRLLR